MKILITTTKRWIAPGSIALLLYFLCSRLSSQNFSRECSTVPINVEENIIERRYFEVHFNMLFPIGDQRNKHCLPPDQTACK